MATVSRREHCSTRWRELEEALEVSERVNYRLGDDSQGSGGRCPILERYLHGDISVHVHFRIRPLRGDMEPRDWCLIFHRAIPDLAKEDRARIGVWLEMNRVEVDSSDGPASLNDKPVLVGIPEIVEHVEDVSLAPVPSTVRLQPQDLCPSITADPKQMLVPGKPVKAALWNAVEDGKPVTTRSLSGFLSVGEYELPDEVIEGRSQVVDNVPDENSYSGGTRRQVDPKDVVVLRTALELAPNAVWLRSEKLADFPLEKVKVLLCPPALLPTPV